MFPKIFQSVEQWLTSEYHVFVAKGFVDLTTTQKCKIKANEFMPIELILKEWKQIFKASLTLPNTFDTTLLKNLEETLVDGSIPLEILFCENGKNLCLITNKKIALDDNTLYTLAKHNISAQIKL